MTFSILPILLFPSFNLGLWVGDLVDKYRPSWLTSKTNNYDDQLWTFLFIKVDGVIFFVAPLVLVCYLAAAAIMLCHSKTQPSCIISFWRRLCHPSRTPRWWTKWKIQSDMGSPEANPLDHSYHTKRRKTLKCHLSFGNHLLSDKIEGS